MPKLVWDQTAEKFYETGVSHGVIYRLGESSGKYDGAAAAWNGLSAVNESPSGAEATAIYANNHKYGELISDEDFSYTIEAYTYPDEFAECIGEKELAKGVTVSQQTHEQFGFSYQTLIGNDTKGTDLGYYIHIVYNSRAAVSERSHSTVNDSPEAETMSWECSTTPVEIEGFSKPTAHIKIDSRSVDAAKLTALEKKLYGDSDTQPSLPTPEELVTLLGE